MKNKNFLILSILFVVLYYVIKKYYDSDKQDPIKIVFVGDIMLSEMSSNEKMLRNKNTPGLLINQGIDPFSDFAEILKGADLSIGNIECCITTSNDPVDKPYTLKANENCIPLLKKYFDVISIANNHTYDYGKSGFLEMIRLLENYSLPYIGGGINIYRAIEPHIVTIKNVKIAILAYDNSIPGDISRASDTKPGNVWADENALIYNITRVKKIYKPDYLILYIHWGVEYRKHAMDLDQLKLGNLAIDLGTDIVVGHHPHYIQNITIYKNKPIFYSLGNFVFHGFTEQDGSTNNYDITETSKGWVLECFLTSDLKLFWNIHIAKLDQNGIPKYSGIL